MKSLAPDPFRTAGVRTRPDSAAVRRYALPRLTAWGLGTIAVSAFLAWYMSSPGTKIFSFGAAVPGLATLAYALEFATGVRFSDWSRRWDGLPAARKFLIGTLVVLGAFVLMSVAIGLAGAIGLLR